MKREYSKPSIVFESFSLCQAIANCDVITGNPSNSSCSYFMPGVGNAFLDSDICGVVITDEMSYNYNGFCYHVPVENANLFNS